MSGYAGDFDSVHVLISNENALHAAREQLQAGPVYQMCTNCEEEIPEARRKFFLERNQRCLYCVQCQPLFQTSINRIKMLDRVL